MKRSPAAAVLAVALLGGCGYADETYRPEWYVDTADTADIAEQQEDPIITETEISKPAAAHIYTPPPENTVNFTPVYDGELRETFTSDENGLIFAVENVFSGGEYYAVVASAAKTDTENQNTVYINGRLYDAPKLTLMNKNGQLGSVKLDIPDGDRFLTLESAADNYSYGSEVISNMRDFGAAEYPDVLGLVFRSSNTEAAVPEYARYFAVFEDRLTELEIYENGSRVSPRGAKLEPVSAGLAKQFLTVLKQSGEGYEIIKYEYRFDLENRRLNRQQVRFYGWDY